MPTYEYRCSQCDHEFEEFQLITAQPISKCPQCGQSKVRRLIGSGSALLFKGSGFYQTDYRSENYKKAAQAESTSSADKSDSSASKTKINSGDTEKKSNKPSKPKETG